MIMTTIDRANPLAEMLSNAFTKYDANNDDKLNADEYKSFYEILKPGIAVDEKGALQISEQDYMARMDKDSSGDVSASEMQDAQVLMPASETNEQGPVNALLKQLLEQSSVDKLAAARFRAEREADLAFEAA